MGSLLIGQKGAVLLYKDSIRKDTGCLYRLTIVKNIQILEYC